MQLDGGVTTPQGFRAAGVSCGIKKKAGALDLALIAADGPVSAAAVFTTNRAVAAPVIVSREHLAHSGGRAQAIVINSGCANACTGEAGLQVARDMAGAAAGGRSLLGRSGARRVDRRHRRAARHREDPRRRHRRGARALRRRRRDCDARHHDDRPVPEVLRRRPSRRRAARSPSAAWRRAPA